MNKQTVKSYFRHLAPTATILVVGAVILWKMDKDAKLAMAG